MSAAVGTGLWRLSDKKLGGAENPSEKFYSSVIGTRWGESIVNMTDILINLAETVLQTSDDIIQLLASHFMVKQAKEAT